MKLNNIHDGQPGIIMANSDELMVMTDRASLEIVSSFENTEKFQQIVGEEFMIFGTMDFIKPGYIIDNVNIDDIPVEWKVVTTETKNRVGMYRKDGLCTRIRDFVMGLDKMKSNKNFFSTDKSVNIVLILRRNR